MVDEDSAEEPAAAAAAPAAAAAAAAESARAGSGGSGLLDFDEGSPVRHRDAAAARSPPRDRRLWAEADEAARDFQGGVPLDRGVDVDRVRLLDSMEKRKIWTSGQSDMIFDKAQEFFQDPEAYREVRTSKGALRRMRSFGYGYTFGREVKGHEQLVVAPDIPIWVHEEIGEKLAAHGWVRQARHPRIMYTFIDYHEGSSLEFGPRSGQLRKVDNERENLKKMLQTPDLSLTVREGLLATLLKLEKEEYPSAKKVYNMHLRMAQHLSDSDRSESDSDPDDRRKGARIFDARLQKLPIELREWCGALRLEKLLRQLRSVKLLRQSNAFGFARTRGRRDPSGRLTASRATVAGYALSAAGPKAQDGVAGHRRGLAESAAGPKGLNGSTGLWYYWASQSTINLSYCASLRIFQLRYWRFRT
eukprot:gene4371-3833_t